MKKIFCLFIFLISFSCFAESYNLLSWNSNYEDFCNYCVSIGLLQEDDPLTHFRPTPENNTIMLVADEVILDYLGYRIDRLYFEFDNDGIICSQTIYINFNPKEDYFMYFLDVAANDKARLIDKEFSINGNTMFLSYKAKLANGIITKYNYSIFDTRTLVSIVYKNYE